MPQIEHNGTIGFVFIARALVQKHDAQYSYFFVQLSKQYMKTHKESKRKEYIREMPQRPFAESLIQTNRRQLIRLNKHRIQIAHS
jgi:hypothetical protein